jgi:hypothetical protein
LSCRKRYFTGPVSRLAYGALSSLPSHLPTAFAAAQVFFVRSRRRVVVTVDTAVAAVGALYARR